MRRRKIDPNHRPIDKNIYVCSGCNSRLDEYLLCKNCLRVALTIERRTEQLEQYKKSVTYDPDEVL